MRRSRNQILVTISILLGLGALSAAGWWIEDRSTLVSGVQVWGEQVGGKHRAEVLARLEKRALAWKKRTIQLSAGDKTWKATREELGLTLDSKRMVSLAQSLGNQGSWWQRIVERIQARRRGILVRPLIRADSSRLLGKLGEIKEALDRPAKETRFDFRRKSVIPGRQGLSLDRYRSAADILDAAMQGQTRVVLSIHRTGRQPSGKVDISTIMGWYETPFKFKGKWRHRAHNLKVAARKLNGHIIWPGQVFSFNETVGPRTAKEGYRVAPVISRGEMVDGMAGGACQISSTLYAAAFFAGLDFVEADVHSQPSHYIELGLDATVVWPDKDLKLKNPYPFPVVLHYEVAFGRVRTEILGPQRPYHTIAFERRIVRSRPYREVTRQDPTMPQGTRHIEQRGEFGYTVRRRRVFFDDQGIEVKAQYWTVTYPPTTLIVKVGTKPPDDPTLPIEELKPIPPKPMPKRFVRILQ